MGSRRVLGGSGRGSTTAGLETDFRTGRAERERRQWRPLDQALAVLWQASPWREELLQMLELLAERADRRFHPLPWSLPVPLRVHGHYTRAEIEAAYCFAEACGYGVLTTESPWIHREGVPVTFREGVTPWLPLRRPELMVAPGSVPSPLVAC